MGRRANQQFMALDTCADKGSAFKTYMNRMSAAEKSVQENGYYSEEQAEEELGKV